MNRKDQFYNNSSRYSTNHERKRSKEGIELRNITDTESIKENLANVSPNWRESKILTVFANGRNLPPPKVEFT